MIWFGLTGANHLNTLNTLNNIGCLYMKQSQYDQALAIFKQVREKEEDQFADNHSGRLTCLNNIGICYMKQAKYDAALELFEEVFAKQKHHLGMKVGEILFDTSNV